MVRTFQQTALIPDRSVLENVLTGAHMIEPPSLVASALRTPAFLRREARRLRAARSCLQEVGLLDRAGDRAGDLPYGEQKLLGVAIALASNPKILLLDEPAAGLNAAEANRLAAALADLRGKGLTLLVVDHNLPCLWTSPIGSSCCTMARRSLTAARRHRDEPRCRDGYLGRFADKILQSKRMSLTVRNLSVRYGGTAALTGVSLDIHPGEILALIGANAAGKSTMLKAVMGLVAPAAGEVLVGDTAVNLLPTRGRIEAGLSLSPEGRHVFPELDVEENMHLGYLGSDLAERGERQAEMWALFPRLKERTRQPAGTLSGGEQQMLAIARAMMAAPKFLLLDEPTLGLAPIMIHEIAGFVKRIKAAGLGILLAEQNAAVALEIADRAHVLQGGLTVIEGEAAVVAADPNVRRAYLGR
jgi:branched-chain amino acid transport system ATP-binding protein